MCKDAPALHKTLYSYCQQSGMQMESMRALASFYKVENIRGTQWCQLCALFTL